MKFEAMCEPSDGKAEASSPAALPSNLYFDQGKK